MKHTAKMLTLVLFCLLALGSTTTDETTVGSAIFPLWEPTWSPRAFTFGCQSSLYLDSLQELCAIDILGDGSLCLLIAGTYPHILMPSVGNMIAAEPIILHPMMPEPYTSCQDESGDTFPQQDVLVGDLNYDGVQDFLAVDSRGIQIFLGDRDAPPINPQCGEDVVCDSPVFGFNLDGIARYPIDTDHYFYRDAELRDLNGDGYLDVVLFYQDSIGVHYGDGTGSLSDSQLVSQLSGIPLSYAWGRFGESEGFWISVLGNLAGDHTLEDEGTGLWFLKQGTLEIQRISNVLGRSLVTGNFNNDGIEDVAVLTEDNVIEIYLMEGDVFPHPIDLALDLEATWGKSAEFTVLSSGDFNGDNLSDIVVLQRYPARLLLYYCREGSFFTDPLYYEIELLPKSEYDLSNEFIPNPGITDFSIQDLDGDSCDEIAFILHNRYVKVLVPSFIPLGQGIEYDRGYRHFDVADFDNDGFMEFISTQELQSSDSCNLSKLYKYRLGRGNLVKQELLLQLGTSEAETCEEIEVVSVANLNSDGCLDIAVLSFCSGTAEDEGRAAHYRLSAWLGNEQDRAYRRAWSSDFPSNTQVTPKLYVADFDGDGNDDIAVDLPLENSLGVLVSPSPASQSDFPPLQWIDIAAATLLETVTLSKRAAIAAIQPSQKDSSEDTEVVLIELDRVQIIATPGVRSITGLLSHDWTEDGVEDLVLVGLRSVQANDPTAIDFWQSPTSAIEMMAVVVGLLTGATSGEFTANLETIAEWPWGARPSRSLVPVLGDFDGDGTMDLAVQGYDLDSDKTTIVVLLWKEGSFGQPIAINVPQFGRMFAIDLDQDGIDEIVIDAWGGRVFMLTIPELSSIDQEDE